MTVTADLTVVSDPDSITQLVHDSTDVTLYAVPTALMTSTNSLDSTTGVVGAAEATEGFQDQETGDLIDFRLKGEKPNPINTIAYAAKDTVATSKLIWMSLVDLISGKFSVQDMSGPVGVVSVIDQAATAGKTIGEKLSSVASLTVFITINIGVFNMLPIPGLDGSRFVFLLLEAIRRKPVKKEHEALVHFHS